MLLVRAADVSAGESWSIRPATRGRCRARGAARRFAPLGGGESSRREAAVRVAPEVLLVRAADADVAPACLWPGYCDQVSIRMVLLMPN